MKTFEAHVASWVANDYRAWVKKHGEPEPRVFVFCRVILRAWHDGSMPSSVARKSLRRLLDLYAVPA
jgi:hypothetical protein